jgi:putative chitinase
MSGAQLEQVRSLIMDTLAALDIAMAAEDAPAAVVAPAVPVAAPEASLKGLRDPAAFFDHLRKSKVLGPTLTDGEVKGCEAILAAFAGQPLSWCAYGLATAFLETAGTMQPIKEYGGAAYYLRMYDIKGARPQKARELGNLSPGDGAKFAGRGYVQLTGRANYAKAEAAIGVPLTADPDLAMVPAHAAKIMVRGMVEGWFTGKTFRHYLPAEASLEQFTNARRIINGQDRAADIAHYAIEFQAALKAGGWA